MSLIHKMIRAARLDASLYEEVEADPSLMTESMTVVAISALAAAVGVARSGITVALLAALAALTGWFIWALLTYLIGTKLLPEAQTKADLGELLRTIGFATAPGALRVLGVLPGVGSLMGIVAGVWTLAAMIVAVRQALDYTSTGRAIAVCGIGFVVYFIFSMTVALVAGGANLISGALGNGN